MFMLLVFLTILTILLSAWFIVYSKHNRYLKNVPGPIPLPLIGHALHYGSVKHFLPTNMKFHKEFGTVFKTSVGFDPPIISITDPKLLEVILGSTRVLTKSSDYRFLRLWLGTGLLTSEPVKWKKHRRILTPAFHFQILEQFLGTFSHYSDILVDKMRDVVNKDSADIYPLVTLCSLDIICATSMGIAINAQEDGKSKYVRSVKEITRLIMERILSILYTSDIFYYLTPNYKAQENTIKILHNYTNGVIRSRKQDLQNIQKSQEDDRDDSDIGIKKRNTFLDTLLKYKLENGSITDEEIREEVDTFMFEGHDTISSAISFTIYSLANNPEVQQKAVEELHSIFDNDKNRPATSNDLHEMKYLEMVIKESLRLYPSVPVYGREASEDIEISGYTFPKGTSLSVFAFGVHRNPEIYPEPEKFIPERFSTENQAARSPYAYIPFSAGSRNCIGQRFAMMEMKVVISKVLRNFELLPVVPTHTLDLVPELILKSSTGVKIGLQYRK